MSQSAASLAGALEDVIAACGDDGAAMAAAREGFDAARGPVFEDEDLWETRTRTFLEWYAIERANPDTGLTPVQAAIEIETDPERRAALQAWARSFRCLAEVVGLESGRVTVVDLVGGAHIAVDERRGLPGVSTGDIAECRVVAHAGEIHFGNAFLWHPEGTRAPLLTHIGSMRTGGRSREDILDFVANLRVRAVRYSHVPAAKVYADHVAQSVGQ